MPINVCRVALCLLSRVVCVCALCSLSIFEWANQQAAIACPNLFVPEKRRLEFSLFCVRFSLLFFCAQKNLNHRVICWSIQQQITTSSLVNTCDSWFFAWRDEIWATIEDSTERWAASDIGVCEWVSVWNARCRWFREGLFAHLLCATPFDSARMLLLRRRRWQSKKTFWSGRCWLSIVMRWHFGRKYKIWNWKRHRSSFAHRKTKASIAAEQWTRTRKLNSEQITICSALECMSASVGFAVAHTRKMCDVRRIIFVERQLTTHCTALVIIIRCIRCHRVITFIILPELRHNYKTIDVIRPIGVPHTKFIITYTTTTTATRSRRMGKESVEWKKINTEFGLVRAIPRDSCSLAYLMFKWEKLILIGRNSCVTTVSRITHPLHRRPY